MIALLRRLRHSSADDSSSVDFHEKSSIHSSVSSHALESSKNQISNSASYNLSTSTPISQRIPAPAPTPSPAQDMSSSSSPRSFPAGNGTTISSIASSAGRTTISETFASLSVEDAWNRRTASPESLAGFLSVASAEMKARGVIEPLILLPGRPSYSLRDVKSFIRRVFPHDDSQGNPVAIRDSDLSQEVRMADIFVLVSALKWAWARLPGGIVTWDAYDLFKAGEEDSEMAIDTFSRLIPIVAESSARASIITDFFDLLSAIAAHWKTSGMGGRKLARLAAWWAFPIQDDLAEFIDSPDHVPSQGSFNEAYRLWKKAADASSHLFFAYLRSQSIQPGTTFMTALPKALQQLLSDTTYPPTTLSALSSFKISATVHSRSVSPLASLALFHGVTARNHSAYVKAEDQTIMSFLKDTSADFADKYLSPESARMLSYISLLTQTAEDAATVGTRSQPSSPTIRRERYAPLDSPASVTSRRLSLSAGLKLDLNESNDWSDFVECGFSRNPESDTDTANPSSRYADNRSDELSSSTRYVTEIDSPVIPQQVPVVEISTLMLDDSFWWVWLCSRGPEETTSRLTVFAPIVIAELVTPSTQLIASDLSYEKYVVFEERLDILNEPVISERELKQSGGKQIRRLASRSFNFRSTRRQKMAVNGAASAVGLKERPSLLTLYKEYELGSGAGGPNSMMTVSVVSRSGDDRVRRLREAVEAAKASSEGEKVSINQNGSTIPQQQQEPIQERAPVELTQKALIEQNIGTQESTKTSNAAGQRATFEFTDDIANALNWADGAPVDDIPEVKESFEVVDRPSEIPTSETAQQSIVRDNDTKEITDADVSLADSIAIPASKSSGKLFAKATSLFKQRPEKRNKSRRNVRHSLSQARSIEALSANAPLLMATANKTKDKDTRRIEYSSDKPAASPAPQSAVSVPTSKSVPDYNALKIITSNQGGIESSRSTSNIADGKVFVPERAAPPVPALDESAYRSTSMLPTERSFPSPNLSDDGSERFKGPNSASSRHFNIVREGGIVSNPSDNMAPSEPVLLTTPAPTPPPVSASVSTPVSTPAPAPAPVAMTPEATQSDASVASINKSEPVPNSITTEIRTPPLEGVSSGVPGSGEYMSSGPMFHAPKKRLPRPRDGPIPSLGPDGRPISAPHNRGPVGANGPRSGQRHSPRMHQSSRMPMARMPHAAQGQMPVGKMPLHGPGSRGIQATAPVPPAQSPQRNRGPPSPPTLYYDAPSPNSSPTIERPAQVESGTIAPPTAPSTPAVEKAVGLGVVTDELPATPVTPTSSEKSAVRAAVLAFNSKSNSPSSESERGSTISPVRPLPEFSKSIDSRSRWAAIRNKAATSNGTTPGSGSAPPLQPRNRPSRAWPPRKE
ncbi:uncharacterized protein V1516DRAFT_687290 [Lipomyces oligophaga]|uniref:uncharacterized protein n=1 Tax=Lipomyces oligophaga TaxID=45792 RepID=UPI0034CE1DA1